MNKEFFPLRPSSQPMIYTYEDSNPEYKGLLKVGYTAISVEQRVAQQYPTKRPDGKVQYRIVFAESAMYSDGGNFNDHDIHRALTKRGYASVGGEWFRCAVDEVKAAYYASQSVKPRNILPNAAVLAISFTQVALTAPGPTDSSFGNGIMRIIAGSACLIIAIYMFVEYLIFKKSQRKQGDIK